MSPYMLLEMYCKDQDDKENDTYILYLRNKTDFKPE